MGQKFFESAHAKFKNRRYLEMRGRNQNFEYKFEILIKFCVEWYIVIISVICSCQSPNQIQDCVGVEPHFYWKLLHMPVDLLSLYIFWREISWRFWIFIRIFDSAHAFLDIGDLSIIFSKLNQTYTHARANLIFCALTKFCLCFYMNRSIVCVL